MLLHIIETKTLKILKNVSFPRILRSFIAKAGGVWVGVGELSGPQAM